MKNLNEMSNAELDQYSKELLKLLGEGKITPSEYDSLKSQVRHEKNKNNFFGFN